MHNFANNSGVSRISSYVRAHKGTVFTATFYILLIVFVGLYVQNLDFSEVNLANFSWYYFFLAAIAVMISRYYATFIWVSILKRLGAKNVSYSKELIYVYAKSWLGRYIPGKAPWILGKIYFASNKGVSKNKLGVSSLLEAALQITVTFAIAFLILALDTRTEIFDSWIRLLMTVAFIGCIIVILPPVFNRVLSVIYRVIKKKPFSPEHHIDTKTVLAGIRLYIGGAIIGGFAFFFIAKAVYPEIAWEDFFYIFGASSLANAISMVAIFAPSGIGVREGVQVALFSVIMPIEIALSIAVITRIWFLIIDFVFYGVSLAAYKLSS